jgi:hypothetical protein
MLRSWTSPNKEPGPCVKLTHGPDESHEWFEQRRTIELFAMIIHRTQVYAILIGACVVIITYSLFPSVVAIVPLMGA